LIGLNTGAVTQSFSTGAVSGTGFAGGLVGYNTGSVSADSFWDTTTSGQASSAGGGTGLATAQAKSQSTLTGLGYVFTGPNPIWVITDGVTYPKLWWQ
jgi:hypothetical protein